MRLGLDQSNPNPKPNLVGLMVRLTFRALKYPLLARGYGA